MTWNKAGGSRDVAVRVQKLVDRGGPEAVREFARWAARQAAEQQLPAFERLEAAQDAAEDEDEHALTRLWAEWQSAIKMTSMYGMTTDRARSHATLAAIWTACPDAVEAAVRAAEHHRQTRAAEAEGLGEPTAARLAAAAAECEQIDELDRLLRALKGDGRRGEPEKGGR